MNTIEQRVRSYFEAALADQRDPTDQQRPEQAAERAISAARGAHSRRGAAPLLAGVAVLVIAATAYLFTSGEERTTAGSAGIQSVAPTITASPSAKNNLAVTRFVHKMRLVGEVEPAALWSKGTLLLAVQDTRLAGFQAVDGHTVGGLRVRVIKNGMSQAEYETAIRTISAKEPFADSNRIAYFSHALDGSYLRVYVRDLAGLASPRRAALVAHLERISALRVVLADRGISRDFVGKGGHR